MIKIETFPPTPKKEKPIAIIGAGGIVSDAHLPAYQKAGFEVKAVYDLNYQKALKVQRQFKVGTTCKDLSELIQVGIDEDCAFDLAVPASAILKVLSDLPDGAGVLIQKPMGENIEQARAILDLCRKKNLVAGINFQLRHAPYITAAKRIIDLGPIGVLHDIDVRMNVYTPWHLWDFLFALPRVEILYHSIHYIDMIRYFLGDPMGVYARTTKHPNMKDLASSRSAIILDYGDMIRANINTNHGHNFGLKHQESYFKFEGTKGAIKIRVGVNLDYPKGLPDQFEYIFLNDDKGWQKLALDGSWFPDAFIGPMAGLMCKLENPDFKYINSVEDAIHTMEVVEKCYESNDMCRYIH
ncbi:MAG: Gfo/Idh/MocA family oxidoreductase [Saprospiraceae bacterium]|nr:Gfo/Idh/MocA family oxidoreductase [Saprospiraceae bacterium]